VKITNRGASITLYVEKKKVVIKHGVSMIDDKLWAEAAKHGVIQRLIKGEQIAEAKQKQKNDDGKSNEKHKGNDDAIKPKSDEKPKSTKKSKAK